MNLLGKYRLVAEIARGGMGIVYLAVAHGPGGFTKLLVVKELKAELVDDSNFLEMFLQEGRLAARLSHPNIVQTYEIGHEGKRHFIVMDYLEGVPLARVARRRSPAFTPAMHLRVICDMLRGLHHAHTLKDYDGTPLGLIHRDVTPQNVFITFDGQAKLVDFGIAKTFSSSVETRNGTFKGKPTYMAPEQLGGEIDHRVDVFAAGVMIWEAIAGQRMWGARSDIEVLGLLVKGHVPSLAEAAPNAPPELVAICMRALAPERDARPPTAAVLLAELEGFLGKSGGDSVRDAAEVVAGLFEKERAEVRTLINRHTSEMESRKESDKLPSLHPAALDSSATPVGDRRLASTPFAAAPPSTQQPPDSASVTRPRSPALFAGIAAAAVALVALGVIGGLGATRARRAVKVEPAASPPAAAAAIAVVKVEPTCAKGMVKIQPGNFFMGSDDKDDYDFEKPAHKVTLSVPFCMDIYEVTTDDYKAASDAGNVKRAGQTNEWEGITAAERKAFDPLCNIRAPEDRGKHPINCVTWEMADAHCRALKKRLPTEAEWEYAARGPDGRKYPWGDELPGPNFLNACGKECMAWAKKNHVDPTGMNTAMYSDDDGFAATAPVGSFPAGKSRYGLHDVVGNVWEWVSDWHAPYTSAESTDPSGPATGDERVIRGGAWNGAMASWVRPTFRYHDTPTKRSHGIGFRCAMTLAP